MASTDISRFTVIGTGETEEQARQNALTQAYINAEFEPIVIQDESYNEGRGVYTLVYSLSDVNNEAIPDDPGNKQDEIKENQQKDEKIEEKKKEDAKGSISNSNQRNLTGSYDNNTKELRSSPGYTNYVVSTGKNINGTVASSSVFKRYYSDISAEAYINGEWFEDINTISWTVNQQQYPIYGYNSYIFDDLALGARIIQGSFTINFTEPNIIGKAIASGSKSTTINNGTTFEEYSTKAHQNKVAINGSAVTYQSNGPRDAIWKPRFDIDIVFGEKEKLGGVDMMPKHIILWDCSVSNSGIGLTANGGVLVETYSFIARDFKIIS